MSPLFGLPPARWWVALLLILFLIGAIIYLESKKSRYRAIATVGLLIFYLQFPVRELLARTFDFSVLILWFFAIAIVAKIELRSRTRSGDWEKTAFTVASVLIAFANFYYPHLKASWGGGASVPITIYFNKDSVIRPSQSVSVQLVEESDEGYYIVGEKEARAVFVPRSSVALVYFSDKLVDSPLLRPAAPP